jgi:hypothetical protein
MAVRKLTPVVVFSASALAYAASAASSEREAPGSPPTECVQYVLSIADAAIATGEASGRLQIYEAFLQQSSTPLKGELQAWREKASQEVKKAVSAGSALGKPPAACAALEPRSILIPAMTLGRKEGGRSAFMSYSDRLSSYPNAPKDYLAISMEVRTLGELNFPAEAVKSERATFKALVDKTIAGLAPP